VATRGCQRLAAKTPDSLPSLVTNSSEGRWDPGHVASSSRHAPDAQGIRRRHLAKPIEADVKLETIVPTPTPAAATVSLVAGRQQAIGKSDSLAVSLTTASRHNPAANTACCARRSRIACRRPAQRRPYCDLTHVDLTITDAADAKRRWNLAGDVADNVLDGNRTATAWEQRRLRFVRGRM